MFEPQRSRVLVEPTSVRSADRHHVLQFDYGSDSAVKVVFEVDMAGWSHKRELQFRFSQFFAVFFRPRPKRINLEHFT